MPIEGPRGGMAKEGIDVVVVVDDAGGVGLVCVNDVHWTCRTRFQGPMIMRNDLIVGSAGEWRRE